MAISCSVTCDVDAAHAIVLFKDLGIMWQFVSVSHKVFDTVSTTTRAAEEACIPFCNSILQDSRLFITELGFVAI